MILELPFDQYQRYNLVREIVEVIRSHAQPDRLRLLDVGGFFRIRSGDEILPLTLFCPRDEAIVVDLEYTRQANFIQADGRALPFPASHFDLVVTCDTLEHVPPEFRDQFVKEILSVSRQFAIIAGPFAREDVTLAEEILLQYTWLLGLDHPALRDHRQKGLPELQQLRSLLEAEKVAFFEFPSGYLLNWLFLMMLKQNLLSLPHSNELHSLLDRFHNLNFCDADAQAPAYRTAFVICKDRWNPAFSELKQRYKDNRLKEEREEKRWDLIALMVGLLAVAKARMLSQSKAMELRAPEARYRTDLEYLLAPYRALVKLRNHPKPRGASIAPWW